MNNRLKDYYGLLGIRPDAAPHDIKAGYARASEHNETHGSGRQQGLIGLELDVAYDTLGDSDSRRLYDSARQGDPDALRQAPGGWFTRGEQTAEGADSLAAKAPAVDAALHNEAGRPEAEPQATVHPWDWAQPKPVKPSTRPETRTDKLAEAGKGYITLAVIVGIILVPIATWFLSESSWGFMGMTLLGLFLVGLAGFIAHNRFTEHVLAKEKEWGGAK